VSRNLLNTHVWFCFAYESKMSRTLSAGSRRVARPLFDLGLCVFVEFTGMRLNLESKFENSLSSNY